MTFRFEVRAQPNAPRNEVVGWMAMPGGAHALKIKVHAPALEGKANEALCDFLAERLGVPKRAVAVVRGDKSRLKLVEVSGLTEAEIRHRLST